MTDQTADLYDVIAVNIKTGARRTLATDKTERNAEAIIAMAVARRGVQEEFCVRGITRDDWEHLIAMNAA